MSRGRLKVDPWDVFGWAFLGCIVALGVWGSVVAR